MDQIEIIIRRQGPDGADSEDVTCHVPLKDQMTVLDAVTWAQRNKIPDLAYRYSCRVGMCGTCAMVINGREAWACRTLLGQLGTHRVTIEPLRNLPVVKDLVVDMGPFFAAMDRAMSYFVPREELSDDLHSKTDTLEHRLTIDPHIECISCGACYSACTMIHWDPDYLGPAALNRVATLVKDRRDDARQVRLQAIDNEHGCWRCHSQFTCSDVCPMNLRPAASIGYLKRAVIAQSLGNLIRPSVTPVKQKLTSETESKKHNGQPKIPQSSIRVGIDAICSAFALKPTLTAAFLGMSVALIYLVSLDFGTSPERSFLLPSNTRDPVILAGAASFGENGCLNCHAILGSGKRTAPDLWRAGWKHGDEWLRTLLSDPDTVLPEGSMNAYHLPEQELKALVSYIGSLDFSQHQAVRLPPSIVYGGSEFLRNGCLHCHEGGLVPPSTVVDSVAVTRWLSDALTTLAPHREIGNQPSTAAIADIEAYLSYLKSF